MAIAFALGLVMTGGPAGAAPVRDVSSPLIPPPSGAHIDDPLQPVNRGLFHVDLAINRLFAGKGRILAMARWVPAPVRAGLYNAFDNLEEPSTLANDILQRKAGKAVKTAGRFTVNSTAGAFGIFDVASRLGLKRTREDFGQTLATWGITPGPYLYVPLTGPTTLRDGLAGLVDGYFSPTRWFPMETWQRQTYRVIKYGVKPSTVGIRQLARGAAEDGETTDEYATLRQLYYDQRAAQIADLPNLADDPISAFPELQPRKDTAKPQ